MYEVARKGSERARGSGVRVR